MMVMVMVMKMENGAESCYSAHCTETMMVPCNNLENTSLLSGYC